MPVLFGMALLLLLPVIAQAGVWKGAGPDGGEIRRIATSSSQPNLVYVANNFYVFRTLNGAETWRLSGTFQESLLRGLWIDAADGKQLYVQDIDGRLWRSDDRGVNWVDIHPGTAQSSGEKHRFSVHPTLGDRLALAQADGVWTSSDAGDTWNKVFDNVSPRLCGIVVSPAAAEELFGIGCNTAQNQRGFYLSVDGGASWQVRTTTSGITTGSVVPHPTDPSRFYTYRVGGDVMLGTNRGSSWQKVGTVPAPINGLAIDPLQPSHLLGAATNRGIYRSTDGGATWTQAIEPEGDILDVAFSGGSAGPSQAFAATTDGMLASADGATWQEANRALRAQIVPRLEQHADGTLFALADDRLWRSTDDGIRWSALGEPSAGDTVSLAIDPLDSNVLYVGSIGRIYISNDGGESWSTGSGINGGAVVWDLEVDADTPQTVYAVGFVLNAQFSLAPWAVRSDDGGSTWQLVNDAGQGQSNTLMRVSPKDASTLFVGGNGLERSTDGGATWQSILVWSSQQRSPSVSDMAFHPTTNRVYVASTDLGVLVSDDGGVTLSANNNGLPSSVVYALVLDDEQPDTLYVATDQGVFRSTDAAATWQRFGDTYLGALSQPIISLMLDRTSGAATLFAGTVGNSLYRRVLSGGCDSARASRNPRDCRR